MIARDRARLIAAAALALAGAEAVAQPAARQGNPNAPKLMVGVFRSADKKLGPDAGDAVRSRIEGDVSYRSLTVLSKTDIVSVLDASGYPSNEALSPADNNALARQIRADTYIEGSVTKTATGFQLQASLILARDQYLVQPLGSFEAPKLEQAAAALSKKFQEAHKAFEPEKKCRLLAREGKTADALREAANGITQFPGSIWLRLCQMGIATDGKRPPAEIIKIAEEIIAIDPNNNAALRQLVLQYEATKQTDKKIAILLKLYQADPNNQTILTQVVNELASSGQFDKARPIIEKAVAETSDPGLTKTYWLILGALEDRKMMVKVGEEMIKLDTAFADTTYFDRTMTAYAADSNWQKVAETAARATAKFPRNARYWGMRFQAEKKAGQLQASIASLRRAMEIDPKSIPAARGQIAQLYIDLNQPDSALAELREGLKAGEDKTVMSALIVKVGDNARKAAEASRSVDDWKRSFAITAFADSNATQETREQAKFLFGYSAFQIAYLTLDANSKGARSCEVAREGKALLLIAQINVPAGGRFAAAAAAQVMGALGDLNSFADNNITVFCRKPGETPATKRPPRP